MSAKAFVDQLITSGRYNFTTEEAKRALSGTADAVRLALNRLRRKGEINSPIRGFWVVVPPAEPVRIVETFERYMEEEEHRVTRAIFEENLAGKMANARFLSGIPPLLTADQKGDPLTAADTVGAMLIARLPGDSWKGNRGE